MYPLAERAFNFPNMAFLRPSPKLVQKRFRNISCMTVWRFHLPYLLQWVIIYSFGTNTDFENKSQFNQGQQVWPHCLSIVFRYMMNVGDTDTDNKTLGIKYTNEESISTDQQRYVCYVCGKSFYYQFFHMRHLRRVHGLLDGCDETFTSFSELKKHLMDQQTG